MLGAVRGVEKAHRPGTPVVFISGSTNEERAEQLMTKGAFDYLQKPFQLEEISKRVARAVGQRRRRPLGIDC